MSDDPWPQGHYYAQPFAKSLPTQPEMTLRDYLAGQALGECFKQAMKRGFENPEHINEYAGRAAFWAYRLADAALVERERERKP